MSGIRLSVIIPTLNRAGLLDRTLGSITGQTLDERDFEILVIDNGSSDNTAEVCAKHAARFRHFRLLSCKDPGLHAGRHLGYRQAQGDFLTYADDDIIALPTWLSAVIEAFEDPKTGLVGGNDIPDFEVSPPDWVSHLWQPCKFGRYLAEYSLIQFHEGQYAIDPEFVFGCNFSVRRNLVGEAGGFHPDGFPASLAFFRGNGETALARRIAHLGYNAVFHASASVRHFVPAARMTLDYLEKRSYNEGISASFEQFRERGTANARRLNRHGTALWIKYLMGATRKDLRPEIAWRQYRGTLHGYNDHVRELRRNEKLRAWCRLESYLDARVGDYC